MGFGAAACLDGTKGCQHFFFSFFFTGTDATFFPFPSSDDAEFQTGPDPKGLLYLHCVSPLLPLAVFPPLPLAPTLTYTSGRRWKERVVPSSPFRANCREMRAFRDVPVGAERSVGLCKRIGVNSCLQNVAGRRRATCTYAVATTSGPVKLITVRVAVWKTHTYISACDNPNVTKFYQI
ncbi:Hypothetical protein SMAX5B_012999 [Scophthalmus maximus]|uniref:Uncharacterized protein n=1 Tax=Scophthalmus maximus TaxID=52904 RepID=A0A2U9BNC1_SCOMX|nr:Hypothetical protein SMAX5B_012999 [Scophthalmus maximus]KAF0036990.1 hypothetical protein F2P81_009864 [Scophthalmus maximus]